MLQRRGRLPRGIAGGRTGFNGAAELLQRRGDAGAERVRQGLAASTEPLNCFSGEVEEALLGLYEFCPLQRSR